MKPLLFLLLLALSSSIASPDDTSHAETNQASGTAPGLPPLALAPFPSTNSAPKLLSAEALKPVRYRLLYIVPEAPGAFLPLARIGTTLVNNVYVMGLTPEDLSRLARLGIVTGAQDLTVLQSLP